MNALIRTRRSQAIAPPSLGELLFGAMLLGTSALGTVAVLATTGSAASAQIVQLPDTAVGTNVPIGIGYGIATVGSDGPFLIGDSKIGSEKTNHGPRALAPQHARLLVRDSKGIPAFRALLAAKTVVPTLVIRDALNTDTFTGVTVLSVVDAYGSATSPVPIADVTIGYGTYVRTPTSGSSASPAAR